MLDDSYVELKVGEQSFRTKRSTLAAVKDTLFTTLLEDKSSNVFELDRDSTHFRYILNFLRHPTLFTGPTDLAAIQELCTEGKYYCMPPAFFTKITCGGTQIAAFTETEQSTVELNPGIFTKMQIKPDITQKELPPRATIVYVSFPMHDILATHVAVTVSASESKSLFLENFRLQVIMENRNVDIKKPRQEITVNGYHVTCAVECPTPVRCIRVYFTSDPEAKGEIRFSDIELYGTATRRLVPWEAFQSLA